MAEKMVRCARCHEVFDADAGPCTKCGTPYQPPRAQPAAIDGLYVERYAGSDFAPVPDPAPVAPLPRRNTTALLIWGGAALLGAALIVAIVAVTLGIPSNSPAAPALVVARTDPPSPTPTLPPTVTMTLQQLNDLKLSAHITVDSRTQLSARILGQGQTSIVTFDGQISGGDESGTIQGGGLKQEFRLVDGVVYIRALPSGKWATATTLPSYLVIAPLFGITSPKMLLLVGAETKDGLAVNHFRTTGWWVPDMSRVAMTNLSGLAIAPDSTVLDLWATPDGAPVAATFAGTNTATDGTRLLDIQVSYTFTDVGVPAEIVSPFASPSPLVSPSPS
jgi:hypothetical protein